MNKIAIGLICLQVVGLLGCSGSKKQQASQSIEAIHESVNIEYAKGFTIREIDEHTHLVSLQDPEGEQKRTYHFALVDRDATPSTEIPKDYEVIRIPIKHAICMTALQLSNFIKLNALDYVSGINSVRHLFNTDLKKRVKDGRIQKIGIEGEFDNELVMAANPDIIFVSSSKRGGFESLKEVGIPLIPHYGYKERTPLGQAEWLKLVGILVGKEAEANATFDKIAQRYNELKKRVKEVKNRPTVLSGEMRNGNWYAVGGKSFLAQVFEDAGAEYILKNDEHTGGFNMDYETIYSKAAKADYWRIMNSFDGTFGYEALESEDQRYRDFDAFRNRHIIYCNMREVPFYETMPVEPEVMLADFIKVFHPDILPQHKPVYYRLLK